MTVSTTVNVTMNNTEVNGSYGNETNTFQKWHHTSWVVPEIIGIILTIATSWILISVIHYGLKEGKWRKSNRKNAEKLNGGMVYTAVVFCATAVLLRCFTSQVAMNVGFGTGKNEECELAARVSLVTYPLTVFAVYIFLWMRQLVFYYNSMLKTPFTKALKAISAGSIVLLFISGLGIIIGIMISSNYISTWKGCIYIPTNSSSETIIWVFCIINLIISQLLLLGLFVYPLHKSKSMALRVDKCKAAIPRHYSIGSLDLSISKIHTSNSSINTRSVKRRRASSVHKTSSLVRIIMLRTIIFAVIAVVTDILCVIVGFYLFPAYSTREISTIVHDLNAFLNLMFVIGSFINWKQMLISPFYSPDAETDGATESSGAHVHLG